MRVEVNREVFNVEAKRPTGLYLRGIFGIRDSEELCGKGAPNPGQRGVSGNSGFIIEPEAEIALSEGREFFTVPKDFPWPRVNLVRERGREKVEISSPGKVSETGAWEYATYIPDDDLVEIIEAARAAIGFLEIQGIGMAIQANLQMALDDLA